MVDALAQHAAEVDREAAFPVKSLEVLRRTGYLGYLVPEAYGGMGGDLAGLVTTAQAMAGGCLSTAMIWAMHCQQVDALVRHGTPRLRAEVLPRVAAGDVYLASVTTQAATGGDLLTADEALLDSDSAGETVLLDRTAPVVTGGAHAEGFLITMRASEDAAEHAVSLVYADRADLEVVSTGRWNPLGMRGTHSGPLHLRGPVRRDDVLGTPGRFRAIAADSTVPVGHIAWSACWLGAARTVFSGLLRHISRDPRQDTSSPLLRERLARVRLDLELVSACLGTVRQEIETIRASGGSPDSPAVRIHLNTLKLAASELSFTAVDRMMQLAGLSLGYSADSPLPLERAFRDLRSAALNYSNDRLWTANGALTLLDRSVRLL
ncbi:acyl-CoA dehydrogenase family protein [Streptomyces sp. TG1A-8]|uniref:acyl-CoA dehydrogenase family protein n=1 Tax=Streptomyces sp. TG1A-8 TaxID=3051385 RepID=UPI00265C0A15|nr:acyl-CoA dehydrogenase family protein [Streptomyces sp. TG1A-8]MDO0925025.1 acyl-CoA dehydrogenase family protein [Streptomyces sp. TG1A-8]